MRPIEPFRKILSDRMDPSILSPVGDVRRPNSLPLGDARSYLRLFSGLFMRRSPARVMRRGLFQSFVRKSVLLKLEQDVLRGYDISLVPYPLGLNLRAWGIVLDRSGRAFEVKHRPDGLLELVYQGGCCRSKKEWRFLVGAVPADESDGIRLLYNQARIAAGNRVIVAGTTGIGLWDALWMAFDAARARDLLIEDPDFCTEVFRHWQSFHLSAVSAMLDAGVKLIFVREHPGGFRSGAGMPAVLDPFIGDYFRELSRVVRSRGGCIFLDCDVDEMLETDYPYHWGFDGVGPLLFRDEEDLIAARRCLAEELFLVGTMSWPRSRGSFVTRGRGTRGIIVTNRPPALLDTMVPEEESSQLAKGVDFERESRVAWKASA